MSEQGGAKRAWWILAAVLVLIAFFLLQTWRVRNVDQPIVRSYLRTDGIHVECKIERPIVAELAHSTSVQAEVVGAGRVVRAATTDSTPLLQIRQTSPGTDDFEAKKFAICEGYGNDALTQHEYAILLAALVGVPLPSAPVSTPAPAPVGMANPAPASPPPAPTLVSVTVTFIMPKGDNRDHDSRTDVAITDGSVPVARADNIDPGKEFADPGTYGPYALAITTAIAKDEFPKTTTTLTHTPNGHDRWETSIRIDATFSDGSKLTNQSPLAIVDQDVRVFQFANR